MQDIRLATRQQGLVRFEINGATYGSGGIGRAHTDIVSWQHSEIEDAAKKSYSPHDFPYMQLSLTFFLVSLAVFVKTTPVNIRRTCNQMNPLLDGDRDEGAFAANARFGVRKFRTGAWRELCRRAKSRKVCDEDAVSTSTRKHVFGSWREQDPSVISDTTEGSVSDAVEYELAKEGPEVDAASPSFAENSPKEADTQKSLGVRSLVSLSFPEKSSAEVEMPTFTEGAPTEADKQKSLGVRSWFCKVRKLLPSRKIGKPGTDSSTVVEM